MRIALNSFSGYGAHFALRLMAEGHDVDYYLSEEKYRPILQGLVKPKMLNPDLRKSYLNYVLDLPDYSKYDLSIFDLTGKLQQAEYSAGQTPTIGDGQFHCILEDNRGAGISFMEESGIAVPPYEKFQDLNEAKAFIKKTNKRYVYKPDGGQDQNPEATYVSKDAEDMLKYIDKVYTMSKGSPFILQEFKSGIEISVEGWFNGTDFYCLNATLEEKKFMNDGIGPNTGCSGNLVFTINHDTKLFKEGLGKIKNTLSSIGFAGMIDLNTIVTPEAAYGLEWTPRFGYDATATLAAMYGGKFGNLLKDIASGNIPDNSWNAEFGASVRITIPPYPTEIKLKKSQGVPLKGIDIKNDAQMINTYMYDVQLDKGDLVSAGINGLLIAPVEIGSSIPEAFGKLKDAIDKIQIPDMQYRTDIQKSVSKRYIELQQMGWI